MKKITSLLIILLAVQNLIYAQSSFGIAAGAAFASYKATGKATMESISITSKTKVGFSVGLTSSIALAKSFSFQPQLNFIQKGGMLKQDGETDKTTLNYLELPLNFVYNTHSTKGKYFAGAGPSLSLGLSGKDKVSDAGESGIKFGSNENDDFKSFEAGINFLAGYQCKGGFFAEANYNTALSNIANNNDGFDIKYHNRYFGIRVGFMLSKLKK